MTDMRVQAARKAVRTRKMRDSFVDKYGTDAFDALVSIVRETVVHSVNARRSLAAYKANLTRNAYAPFITVTNSGRVVDKMGLDRV